MDDVRKLLESHEVVDLDGLGSADSVDVVPGEIDKHDVLGSVLGRRKQAGSKGSVLCKRPIEDGAGARSALTFICGRRRYGDWTDPLASFPA